MEGYTFSMLMQKPKSLFIFSVYSILALPEKKNNKDYAVFNHEFCGISVTGNLNVRKCIYEEV